MFLYSNDQAKQILGTRCAGSEVPAAPQFLVNEGGNVLLGHPPHCLDVSLEFGPSTAFDAICVRACGWISEILRVVHPRVLVPQSLDERVVVQRVQCVCAPFLLSLTHVRREHVTDDVRPV